VTSGSWRAFRRVVPFAVLACASLISGSVVAVDYVDNFGTNPFAPDTWGSSCSTAQLTYNCPADGDGCDLAWTQTGGEGDSGRLDNLSRAVNLNSTEKLTITANDGSAFDFVSIWYDIRANGTAATITGVGPEPFTIDVSPGDATTFTPGGGAKHVTSVEITNVDFWNDILDTVTVRVAVPGMDVQGDGTTIVNGDDTPSAADDTDLGETPQGVAATSTFTIRSIGGAALDLEGSPYVTLSANPSGDFSISVQPTTDPMASGTTDTFTISCTPSGAGARTATVRIDNDSEADPYTFDVTCTGTAPEPEIDIEGNGVSIPDGDTTPAAGDHTDFGDVVVGSNLDRTFTIQNEGTANLTLTNHPNAVQLSTNPSGDFSIETQPTSGTVAASGSVTFVVRCTPSATGDRTATVSVASNDSDEDPYTFTVEARGTAPEIDIEGNGVSIPDGDTTPSAGDHTEFGNVAAGSSFDRTFTIQNEGNANLTLTNHPSAVALSGSGDFSVHTQAGSGSIAPSGSTTFVIRCTPSGTGERTATVSVASNDGDEDPYTFTVRATGIAPEMDVSGNGRSIPDNDTTPTTLDDTDFGNVDIVGGTNPNTFTISNTGGADLNLDGATRVAITGDAADFTVTDPPTTPVASGGGTTTFEITFDPTVGGVRSATVLIANNDLDEDPYTFDIQGTGDAPEMDVTGQGISIPDNDTTPRTADDTDFGAHLVDGGSDTHTFTIRNTGAGTLTLDGAPRVALTGHTTDFTVTTQPPTGTVASSGTTTFDVHFDPTAVGQRTATVSIANNDANEDPYTFDIQGTGTAPEIDIEGQGQSIVDGDNTPDVADDTEFGDLDILAAPIVHTFTIENEGTADLNLTGTPNRVTVSNAAFSVSSQPGASVAPAGTTTFDISFDPAAIGDYTGTVTVANDDADENPYTFGVHGAGTSAPEIDVRGNGIEIPDGDTSPATNDDTEYGTVDARRAPVTHTFTIHNTGSEALTLTDAPNAVTVDQAVFQVTAQPASPIPVGGQATFDLAFDPIASVTTLATVSIANNDANEDPYTFQVRGTGTRPMPGGGGSGPTSGPPTATTETAMGVTMTSATVRGTIHPNNLATDVYFECGAESVNGLLTAGSGFAYTETVACQPNSVSGVMPVRVSATLSGLVPGTTYHFRVVARNSQGTTYGTDATFGTPAVAVGDVDGDGETGLLDVLRCAQIAVGERSGTAAEREQADVDVDGDVDMEDVTRLSEYVLGIRAVLP